MNLGYYVEAYHGISDSNNFLYSVVTNIGQRVPDTGVEPIFMYDHLSVNWSRVPTMELKVTHGKLGHLLG